MNKIQRILEVLNIEKNPYNYQPKDVKAVQLKMLDDKGKAWYGVKDFPNAVLIVSFHNDIDAGMRSTLPDHALKWSFFDKKDPNVKKVGYIEGNGNLGTVSFLWDATKIEYLKSYIEDKGIKPEYIRVQSGHL